MPKGCSFAPRCFAAFERCRREMPVLKEIAPKRPVSCFVAQGEHP
jgi:oligopeptide/dipeptide ABC transporter ATP-binding protein